MTDEQKTLSGYRYSSEASSHSHAYLEPTVLRLLGEGVTIHEHRAIFEIGSGNGSFAKRLTDKGWDVTGIEPSTEGLEIAQNAYPNIKLYQGSAYDALSKEYGQFPFVISLEVIEHVFFPRKFAATVYELLEPGGLAIISTPYHGYLKNLALAISGKMDAHFTALWDYGHIKFFSISTLGALLLEVGFFDLRFYRVGRVAPLAKSMVVAARKPISST